MNIDTSVVVQTIVGIIVIIIGAYCKSLVKSLEDVKQHFEDYKKEDAAIEKKQDEKILTLENRQEQGLQKLSELEGSIKADIKELSTKITKLSDVIIGLSSSIKHLEEKK